MFVDIVGDGEVRGRVTRLAGKTATVKFDRPIDWDALPAVGALREAANDTVFRSEREAVALLRDRESRNPHLLDAVVENKVRKIPETHAEPRRPLNPEQRRAFERAMTVEDLLLVHGPPGTGKTRTISEMARAAVVDFQQKVLISSHSNRAVDNVLGGLPRDLEVLRVGYRDSVTPEGLPYLLEERVSELRERIQAATARSMGQYGDLATAESWHRELGTRIGRYARAADELAGAELDLERATSAAAEPFESRLADLARSLERISAGLERRRSVERRRRALSAGARARTAIPLLGLVFAFVHAVLARFADQAGSRRRRIEAELAVLAEEHRATTAERDREVESDPAVKRSREQSRASRSGAESAFTAASEAADNLGTALRGLLTVHAPSLRDAADDPSGALAALEREHARIARELPLLMKRGNLLGRWHTAVASATDQLRNEFVRYADVIAATCIGSASRPELSGIDFDLAVIDEAGQIGINDVLVPLTRARRGVLVGDAQQLPPFLDSEVRQWGAAVDDSQVREMLAKSALEILSARLPQSHQVALAEQRRMPATIADFVSDQFYGSTLRTVHKGRHRDSLMHTPMTLIDTSGLPPRRRMERGGSTAERWSLPGYVNRAEAELLAQLAAHYHHLPGEGDWCLIVPYRAQLQLVRSLLRRRIADPGTIELNAGTVDSFQGGERDVVLYGFTRSNRAGKVGFLSELRRLNVAFTRARFRLVMVGDRSTLTASSDESFRSLMADLEAHLTARGEVRSFEEIQALLDRVEKEG
nr:AAA domain-containing protein [Glycomyces sp. L485]